MNEFAARIEWDFPLRRKEKEKMEFRTWLVHTFKELGYTPKLESGESALAAGGGVTNVVVGDIDKAKIVLAAHYDTGVRELLPPLICPTRPLTFLLYQALYPLLLVAGSFLLSFAVTFPLFDVIGRISTVIALFSHVDWKPIPHDCAAGIDEMQTAKTAIS